MVAGIISTLSVLQILERNRVSYKKWRCWSLKLPEIPARGSEKNPVARISTHFSSSTCNWQPVAPRFSLGSPYTCTRIRRCIDLPRSFIPVTITHTPGRSPCARTFRFTCLFYRVSVLAVSIKRTLARSHGVVLMPAERMRNAYACTLYGPLSCLWCALARVYTYPIGGSSHTSSGGFPSHVFRGENVPPANRKGR